MIIVHTSVKFRPQLVNKEISEKTIPCLFDQYQINLSVQFFPELWWRVWRLPHVSVLSLIPRSLEGGKLWNTPCVAVASNFSSPAFHSGDWSKSLVKTHMQSFTLSHTLQIGHTLGPEGDIFTHCPFIWSDINLWPCTLFTVLGCNRHHFQFKYLFLHSWCSFQSFLHLYPLNSFSSYFSLLPSFTPLCQRPCKLLHYNGASFDKVKPDFVAIISMCVPLISTQTALWPVAQCHNQCQSL